MSELTAGRSCPLHYRYAPEALAGPASRGLGGLHTLYVAGGVYGNLRALQALVALVEADPSPAKALVLNGDFHWFDVDPVRFAAVQALALQQHALRGNVETELADEAAEPDAGCGCAYPAWVGDGVVERSNRILSRLSEATTPAQRAELAALPMHARAEVGGCRVVIVHGDAESLAGWGLAQEHLSDAAAQARADEGLRRAQADAIVSSHTCLPVFQRLASGWVFNNGAAGMPNFEGDASGLVVRLGVQRLAADTALETRCHELYVQALRLPVDGSAQRDDFLAQWPVGSDAHESYFDRIANGPKYQPGDALRDDDCSGSGRLQRVV
jgi:predicted phosphodiesterase